MPTFACKNLVHFWEVGVAAVHFALFALVLCSPVEGEPVIRTKNSQDAVLMDLILLLCIHQYRSNVDVIRPHWSSVCVRQGSAAVQV